MLPDEVLDAELHYLAKRRACLAGSEVEDIEAARTSLAGLCLSGGGVRAATVALGFLQGLARGGALAAFDLMSTVSGGGYLGGCLTSLFSDEPEEAAATRPGQRRWKWQGYDLASKFPLGDAAPGQVHHLRAHGNLVIGSLGLFRRDTLRAIGTVVRGTAASLLFFASALALVVSLYALLCWALAGGNLFTAVAWSDAGLTCRHLMGGWNATGRSFLLALGVGGLYTAVRLRLWKREVRDLLAGSRGGSAVCDTAEDATEKYILRGHALHITLLVIVGGVAMGLVAAYSEAATARSVAWFPAGVFLGALATGLLAEAVAALRGGRRTALHRSFCAALNGVGLVGLAIAVGAVAFAPFSAWLGSVEVSSLTTLITALVSAPWLSRWVGRERSGQAPGALARLVRQAILPVLALATLLISASLMFQLLSWAWASKGLNLQETALYLGVGSSALVLFVLSYVNYDALGPQGFYRDRLADAYLTLSQWEAASSASGNGSTHPDRGLIGAQRIIARARDHRELRLSDVLGGVTGCRCDDVPPAPYHILEASLNVPGASHMPQSRRRAVPFFFSRLWCGSSLTGYVRTSEYWSGRLTLAQAMAISGAAAHSVLGWFHTASRAFFLTLFNIRLGVWLPNPAQHASVVGRPGGTAPAAAGGGEPSQGPLPWLFRLLAECTGTTHASGAYVNLSDGGHTGDNLGLVPLVQRRCRTIVVLDAENDPKLRCSSLASAVRQCLVDENVVVQLDLPIRLPGAGTRVKTQVIEGKIQYPAFERGKEARGPAEGKLIYVKLALDEEAPAAAPGSAPDELLPASVPVVVESRVRSDTDFPHTPTYDLAYDEDQFEAHRAMGEYLAQRLRASGFLDQGGNVDGAS